VLAVDFLSGKSEEGQFVFHGKCPFFG